MCLIAALHLEVFSCLAISKVIFLSTNPGTKHTFMLQILDLLRIKSDPLLAIPHHSVIRPRRLPELIAEVHVLIRHSIPLIMRNNIIKPKRLRCTFRPTSNDIPRHPPVGKMVQTAESARQHVRIQITSRSRHTEAERLGHSSHGRDQDHGIHAGGLVARFQLGVAVTREDFLPAVAVGEEDVADLAALGEFGEVGPVFEAVFGVALVGRVAPLARRHVAAGAGIFEEVEDDAFGCWFGLCGAHLDDLV
jgi:hypothetical protein